MNTSPAPRRSGIGWWFAGCGCLVVVVLFVLVAVFIGGALLAPDDDGPGGVGGAVGGARPSQNPAGPAGGFAAEAQRFHALAAQLEGNPVAPLVTQMRRFQLLEQRAAAPRLSEAAERELTRQAQEMTAELEQRIDAAEARSTNSSGSVTEQLVDDAGAGYIDIGWDAATACAVSEKEGRTTAGCVSENPVAVHILPEAKLSGDLARRIVVLHELTHLYQRADLDDAGPNGTSGAERLVQQGLFEGSSEKMADCYALTYLDQWNLSPDGISIGYGYVCSAAERQAIRDWAASVHAPMP